MTALIRRAAWLAIAFLALALAPLTGFAGTTQTPPVVAGGVPAQTSNGAAAVGALGEFVSAQSNNEAIAVTITFATPAVVTMTANTYAARCVAAAGSANACELPIYFTGLAGTHGVSNTTTYWVCPQTISGANFSIATTAANCVSATYVATSGTDSGTGNAAAYTASSGVGQPIQAINLTAGDWDCSQNVAVAGVASTAITILAAGMGGSGAVSNVDGSSATITAAFTAGATANVLSNGPARKPLSAQTLIFGNANVTWTGGATNPTLSGLERCRRVE